MNRKEYIENKKLEKHEKLLNKLFNKEYDLIIFDIGACEGESSIRYKQQFKNAQIHLFEPLPNNVKLIEDNIKTYQVNNFIVTQKCLSNQLGKVDFFVSSGNPNNIDNNEDWDYGNKSSSLLEPNKTLEIHDWLKFKDKIEVETSTIDNYCAEKKITTIDFIHMDVQGAELMVLEGAKSMLQKIQAIWLEVENVELYKNQPIKTDIEAFLENNNFIKVIDTVNDVAGDQFWVNQQLYSKKTIVVKINILKYRLLKQYRKIYNLIFST
ncbi:MAG: FkbM family methyltransferase [Chitinophagales bacterium]|nr:FkbM family methyltransferase [Chitinophagales bacterium]